MQILKKNGLSGGDTKITKIPPMCQNFFLSFTNNIFVVCDLKVIKNNRNTYHNINFDKKLPKKYSVHISGYIPSDIFPISRDPTDLITWVLQYISKCQ